MKQLQRIINSLDKQPVNKYSAITGRFYDEEIVYVIKNAYGELLRSDD